MKSLLIARQLLWSNRWLWLLLLLWPWLMTAFLLIGSGRPAPEDVQTVLVQESAYGLALVAFAGGSLLGNEQRSRRIVLVLAHAVSRREYLGALWIAAFLPLLAYGLDLAATGALLQLQRIVLVRITSAVLLLGLVEASLSVLASLLLPGAIAGILGLGSLGFLLLLPARSPVALTDLVQVLWIGLKASPGDLRWTAGALEALLLAAALFEVGVRLFGRQDLSLKSE